MQGIWRKEVSLGIRLSLYGSPDVIRQSSTGSHSNVDGPEGPNRLDRRNGPHRPDRLSRPFRENDATDQPLSPYAVSKKAAETLCCTYHDLYEIDVTVLRYFTVYGPAGRPDMSLFRFVQRISEGRPITVYGAGQQSRDFTYVDDIGRGTLAAVKLLNFEVINLGSDQPIVLQDAIQLIERLVDRQSEIEFKPRRPADIMATWADIGKAERLLRWRPTTKFEDGVASLVEWYRRKREWAKDVGTDGNFQALQSVTIRHNCLAREPGLGEGN